MSSEKEYNIILLGETGTGKSLFINSVANFMEFEDLLQAMKNKERVCLISSKFEVTDSNGEFHVIEAGENDGNERSEIGESFTIGSKSYKFKFGDAVVRLIDTPGVGDTKGEWADIENINNILGFVNNYENLHAIAIVLNSSDNKLTDRFSYCLKTLLQNLNRTVVDNLIIIVTHSNDFKPGPVDGVMEKFFKLEVERDLKLDRSRFYCFENQSYEYLMATHEGVQFDPDDIGRQNDNWKRSTKEMKRLVKHVSGLNPYKVRDTTSLNDARQFIRIINPFLPDLIKNIEENANRIVKFQKEMQMTGENLKNMKSDDSLKQVDIKIIPMDKAITFCVSAKCRRVIQIGGEQKYHYPQTCCVGCGVINSWRWWCEAMDWDSNCKVCNCPGGEHDRRFYRTEIIPSNFLTAEAQERIMMTLNAEEQLEIQIETLRERKAQLLLEQKVLEDAEKNFTKFLRTHALVQPPVRRSGGNDAVFKAMEKYEKEIEKMACMSLDEFYQLKTTLVNLPVNGRYINQILDANNKGLKASVGVKETVKNYLNKFEDFLFN